MVASQDAFPDKSQLISIAAALLDLQHYHPLLLQTAAAAVLAESPHDLRSDQGPLGPDAVVSMLLALGFFRVQAPEFVEAALQVSLQGFILYSSATRTGIYLLFALDFFRNQHLNKFASPFVQT